MSPDSGNKTKAIGVMSGTSLDGLDIAAVEFSRNNSGWNFQLVHAETVLYSAKWESNLRNAPTLSGENLIHLHSAYGKLIGNEINSFLKKTGFKPDLIASHGHTVFHQPCKGFTYQIGNGAEIASLTQILTIADFRSGDVALGGQGAPLVPVGDRLLFSEYDYCLNLGGFANVSFENSGKRIAFDVCPVNIVLNQLAELQGYLFDKDGLLGQKGELCQPLLDELDNLSFYHQNPPKSLSREWVENDFNPVLNKFNIAVTDKLRTVYRHAAFQISKIFKPNQRVLITGGGAFNSFLISELGKLSETELIIPSDEIVKFKEAIVFAFLGVLRLKNEPNCLASITGAKKDSSGGIIFQV